MLILICFLYVMYTRNTSNSDRQEFSTATTGIILGWCSMICSMNVKVLTRLFQVSRTAGGQGGISLSTRCWGSGHLFSSLDQQWQNQGAYGTLCKQSKMASGLRASSVFLWSMLYVPWNSGFPLWCLCSVASLAWWQWREVCWTV